jgi:hypothetical protein
MAAVGQADQGPAWSSQPNGDLRRQGVGEAGSSRKKKWACLGGRTITVDALNEKYRTLRVFGEKDSFKWRVFCPWFIRHLGRK